MFVGSSTAQTTYVKIRTHKWFILKESFKSSECPALLLLRRCVQDVMAAALAWMTSGGSEMSLKKSLANGDTPLEKPAHAWGLCHNHKQKLREQTGKSSSATKGHSESRSLITEKDAKGTVNMKICDQTRKRPEFYISTLIICLQVLNFTFAMTCF